MKQFIKKFQVIDKDSGEVVLEKTNVAEKSQNGKDWCIMYQLTAFLLATDKSYTFSDVRVYLFICANVDWKCIYMTTKVALAEKVGISYRQLQRALKKLKSEDLIREGKIEGQTYFAINPERVTRGKNRGQLRRAFQMLPADVVKKIAFEEKCAELVFPSSSFFFSKAGGFGGSPPN